MTKAKQRDPASQALVDLRNAMELTQQEFAVDILDCATTTISRYESFGPPKGEMLLKLRGIAHARGLTAIANQFQGIWLEEVKEAIGPYAARVLIGESNAGGLLVATLPPGPGVRAGMDFLTLLQHFESGKEPFKSAAMRIFKSMQEAARAGKEPLEKNIEDMFFGKHASRKR
jgi:hypothetical protein